MLGQGFTAQGALAIFGSSALQLAGIVYYSDTSACASVSCISKVSCAAAELLHALLIMSQLPVNHVMHRQ